MKTLSNGLGADIDRGIVTNHEMFNSNDKIAWVADDTKSKDKFLAVFYASESSNVTEATIPVD